MSKLILGVHGVAQQFKGENILIEEWLPPLKDGLKRNGLELPEDAKLEMAFYGDLFRPAGTMGGMPPYSADDVEDGFEAQLLEAMWREAADVDSDRVAGPDADTMGTPKWIQRALNGLIQSRFFAGVAEKALIGDLKQANYYLNDRSIRESVQQRLTDAVGEDQPAVIIGHSLGSVVAYEALCANPDWGAKMFISVGSPLGIQNLIFDNLEPKPGGWPGEVKDWVNVADSADIVALEKNLSSAFGDQVEDILVDNGATAHNISPYLTAKETGAAVATGLGLQR